MPKFKVGDRVAYMCGWINEMVGGTVLRVKTRDEIDPLDAKNSPNDTTFYEVDSDDGSGPLLPESMVEEGD